MNSSNKSFEENKNIRKDVVKKLVEIKKEYLNENVDFETTKKRIEESIDSISPEEFAYSEQILKDEEYSDGLIEEKMDELIELVDQHIIRDQFKDLDPSHPISSYRQENKKILEILEQIEAKKADKFIKNQWEELYEQLEEFKIHLSRKQNQLFSELERKGFDRPSKIMWTFDNAVRDAITKAHQLLKEDQDENFIAYQEEVVDKVRDIIYKEETILYPTALELISEEEFKRMRKGDDEIGYCLIQRPEGFLPQEKTKSEDAFASELASLLQKHGFGASKEEELDVAQGKLTLDQINLIFKHMPVDLSYVDEEEIMRFYTDTKHRVFPRSKGVIGRDVKNCHPRESVATVERIIEAFRNNEQDQAEFWIEMNGQFIYILYVAVRDDDGKFRGVLEMMQNATHIRSLKGSQRLLSWDEKQPEKQKKEGEITKDTVIGELIKKYPFLKEYLVQISPAYKKLLNPILFKTMSKVATIEMVAARGGFSTEELIEKLLEEIKRQ